MVVVPAKSMHRLIKEQYKLSKKLTRKSASVANLQILKSQQRWHQREARKLGKLIAAMAKDLPFLADSESEDDSSSSDGGQDIKMVDARAATHGTTD